MKWKKWINAWYAFEMKWCHLGPCFCEDKQGHPDRNEIICGTSSSFERMDPCSQDEGCIGPNTPDKAQLFSRTKFCSKGAFEVFAIQTRDKW